MSDFFRAGGYSMWIVLLFGGISLISAALLVWRPDERKLAYVRGMSTACVFAILSGLAANLAATFANAARNATEAERVVWVLTGAAESLAPAILGFTMLALVWALAAVGMRRLIAQ